MQHQKWNGKDHLLIAMFKISVTPLENLNLREGLNLQNAGAFNCFEGWVRNRNKGRVVSALEYEAYDVLCEHEAEKIFQETYQKFDILTAHCFHRVGILKPGELSVWVGVVAEHRDASFQACRYIIDQVKFRLPIWKKEYYADGHSGWLASEPVSYNT